MNHRGVIHLFLIILLIVGIGVGIYLVRQIQIFSPQAASVQTEFYVSPSGLDTNDGTINAPFKTIDRARLAVRTVNKTGNRITVFLRGGMHTLASPLIFDPEDSGFNNQYVVYQGYPGEIAVISGGKQITGWVVEGDKWRAPSQGINTRLLIVNGIRAVRARTSGVIPGAEITSTGYTTSDPALANYRNKSDIEVISKDYFRHFRCPVQDITGMNIVMKPGCFASAQVNFSTIKTPDWVENAYELLDQPGEWYLDKPAQMFYYKPRVGETPDSAIVVAPVLDQLIIGHGTPENPIHHIAFQNLRFEHTTWNENSIYGYVGGQSLLYFRGPAYTVAKNMAAVSFETARNLMFVNNVFQHLGAVGLSLDYGSQDNQIIVNHFTDISGEAIGLGDFDYNRNGANIAENNKTKGNVISNNYIHDVSAEYLGSSGIAVLYAQNTEISHNEIFGVNYDGISVNTYPARQDESVSKNNIIRWNLIYDHMKTLMDGGGIYVNSNQTPSFIAENVIHTQHHTGGMIYLDDGATGFNISGNVVHNPLQPDIIEGTNYPNQGRTFSAKGCNHTIAGNYWQLLKPEDFFYINVLIDGTRCDGSNSILGNTEITNLAQVPQNLLTNSGLQPENQWIKSINLNPMIPSPTTVPTSSSQPSTLPSITPIPPGCAAGVSGFYYSNRLSYYYTSDETYFPNLLSTGWTNVGGPFFYAYKTPINNSVPIYAFFNNSVRTSFFYTADESYLPTLRAGGWTDHGVLFYAFKTQKPGTVPVHSFYYTNRLDRYLTTDQSYFQTLKTAGWTDEGVMFYAFPNQASSCVLSLSPSPVKVGDLNADGKVDIFDFNLFLQDYKNGNLRSDLNYDGKVDIFDFNIMLKNFGK